ncbi:sensor histidine kinase YesM [Pedobacter cryoconitis]|uniref:Sensor histidine kinase YesM n=1 Tax=Pedobacter cryoconitis TaxID=188932 RepID=A0A7W9DXQ1_9SPHI|nr:histidine kinase [Pedobacter cryoconitis]MBB5634404.1 sensor histidine kinase YesM [Pedobacter cryoconitis]MBB6272471.1 sensor histidine kinase YesM [Pedobacter cryoconitis]
MTSKQAVSIFSSGIFRVILPLIVTSVLIFSMMIINPISERNYILEPELSRDFFMDLIWFITLGWAITEIGIIISYYLDQWLPWVQFSVKRFFLQLFIQCVLVIAVMTSLWYVTDLVPPYYDGAENDWVGYRQMIFVSIVLSLIVTAVHIGSYLLLNWKNAIVEAAELKQTTLQSQLQSLKLQLDPHFMFNNFSTLSSLIAENQSEAQQFLDCLSEVHRYMLYNLERNVIPLKEELDFITSYIYLIKIRFSENLKIEVTIKEDLLNQGIPPTTLQLLIENAVKHNIASRSQPLHIRISSAGNTICVANNIQKLPSCIGSSKIGLKNIINRYKLLSAKLPEIIQTAHEFVVKIPLLPLKTSPNESTDYRR